MCHCCRAPRQLEYENLPVHASPPGRTKRDAPDPYVVCSTGKITRLVTCSFYACTLQFVRPVLTKHVRLVHYAVIRCNRTSVVHMYMLHELASDTLTIVLLQDQELPLTSYGTQAQLPSCTHCTAQFAVQHKQGQLQQ